jgi:plastocyanin
MLRIRTLLAAVAVLALALTAVQFAAARSHVTTTVTVKAKEFNFALSTKTGTKTVVFKVTNVGKLPHDFKISGRKTSLIPAGKSAILRVNFPVAGKYRYLCTVPGHAAAGMKGVFTVK